MAFEAVTLRRVDFKSAWFSSGDEFWTGPFRPLAMGEVVWRCVGAGTESDGCTVDAEEGMVLGFIAGLSALGFGADFVLSPGSSFDTMTPVPLQLVHEFTSRRRHLQTGHATIL